MWETQFCCVEVLFVCLWFLFCCALFFFKSEVSFHGYADVQVCKGYVISGTVEEVC